MRTKFIGAVAKRAEVDDRIFILCADLGYSVLDDFARNFPNRFINVGVAEQNMMATAAGLALEGFKVYTYSLGNFATLRCMEQIRYDICYHELDVNIIAVGCGYAYGAQGVSHHATEDISMLRAIPGMKLCSPADAHEAIGVANFTLNQKGPTYIRLNKSNEELIHQREITCSLKMGGFLRIWPGDGVLLISTGAISSKILNELRVGSFGGELWTCPIMGKYNESQLIEATERFKKIITVEEHQLNGGFGSSILEAISDLYCDGKIKNMPRFKRIGVDNRFLGICGSQEYLRDLSGLSIVSAF